MSTYSTNLRLELIGTGEQAGVWGATTNNNLGTLLEAAVTGYTSVSVTSANQALTALNGAPDQSRNMALALTTTTTAAFNVYAPPTPKAYVIQNASAYSATLYNSTIIGNTTAAGTGITIPAGKTTAVWTDGTNFRAQESHLPALTLTTDLAVADGGTGASDAATAQTNLNVPSRTGTGASGTWPISISGSAPTLTTPRAINGTNFDGSAAITTASWGTSRTLSYTGDATGSAAVDGSTNVATALTLANTTVTPGTYNLATVTVDGKGRITSASSGSVTTGVTIVDDTTTNLTRYPTFTSATSGQIGTENVSSTKFTFNPSTGALSATSFSGAGTGLTGTASSLTAGTVTNGFYTTSTFNLGTTSIAVNRASAAQSLTGISIDGNAGTATTLQTARTINGVSFNGSANITVTANNPNAATFNNGGAGALSGSTYDGSAAVTISYNTVGAPSTTGTNASGTWNIGISGTAANATNIAVTDDTTTNATRYLTFVAAATGNNAANVSSTKLTYNPSTGALSATSHVSSSDERLKTNWRALPLDFVEQLSKVKNGVYDRIDVAAEQVGVSAQSLQAVLPQGVLEDAEGYLSVAYGQTALAACVELAKEVVILRKQLAELKGV